MSRKFFPHPLMTLALTFIWLALVNKVTLGNLILGFGLGVVIPILTAPYWPDSPRVRAPVTVIKYVLIVLYDICVANVQVAMIILFKRREDLRSQWVAVPLELTSPTAITVLAGTITMTPGTVSAVLSADARSILVHCLDTDDPAAVRDEIKTRYESRLKEIYE
jgi:multicomponent K+:H+ antiporter subunit E